VVTAAVPVEHRDQAAERPGDPPGGPGRGRRRQRRRAERHRGERHHGERAERGAAPVQAVGPGLQAVVERLVRGHELLEQRPAGGHEPDRDVAARCRLALRLGVRPPGVGAGDLFLHRRALGRGGQAPQCGHGRGVLGLGPGVDLQVGGVTGQQVTAYAALAVGEHAAQVRVAQLQRLHVVGELVDRPQLDHQGGHLDRAGPDDEQHQDGERPGEQLPDGPVRLHPRWRLRRGSGSTVPGSGTPARAG
jgi:hypothetical protein